MTSTLVSQSLPDHTQLPDKNGEFVKNFQEHPQSVILTTSILPVLEKLHPDGNFCIGQDSGIYWRITDPPERGAVAPDWFYVPHVPPLLNGIFRQSYVLWQEIVAPLIAIEFVSGSGAEERDTTPYQGKFWVYEQAIRIPFYAIFDAFQNLLEVYHLVDGHYAPVPINGRGHYAIPPMGVELGIVHQEVPWLRWWDDQGNLLLTAQERAEQAEAITLQERLARREAEEAMEQERLARETAEQLLAQERQEKQKLLAYLQSMGINPDTIP